MDIVGTIKIEHFERYANALHFFEMFVDGFNVIILIFRAKKRKSYANGQIFQCIRLPYQEEIPLPRV